MLIDGKIAPVNVLHETFVQQFEQARASPWQPVYLEDAQPKGWTAPGEFYVMFCDGCKDFSVTYPCGYAQRIHCMTCREYAMCEDAVDGRATTVWLLIGLLFRLAFERVRLFFKGNWHPRLPK